MFGRTTVFYDEMKGEWDMQSAGDLVMSLGDFVEYWVVTLMDLMGFMESMLWVKGILEEGCY